MDDPNQNARAKLREDPSCVDETYVLKEDRLPDARPSIACDPAPLQPAADPFVKPEECPPEVVADILIPPPLNVLNEAVTVHCGDSAHTETTPPKPSIGQEGYSYTVNAGSIVQQISFSSIPNITAEQLTYDSGLSGADRLELVNPTTTIARIVELTGLNVTQGTWLKNTVTSTISAVAALALQEALDSIACFYVNAPVTLYCDPNTAITDGTAGSTDHTGDIPEENVSQVKNPVYIAADLFSSPYTQEDADAQAHTAAENLLQCLYCNDEVTRVCYDIGFVGETVQNGVHSSDGRVTVNTYTVAPNSICTNEGKATANSLAQDLADASLSCFYVNPQISVDCSTINRQAGSPGTTGPGYGDFLNNVRGQTITVPAGYIVSLDSTDDAYEQAYALAIEMLDCWVCNDPITLTCPTDPIVTSSGTTVQIPESSGATSTIDECTIQADTLDDANAQASDRAFSQLSCTYCNPDIAAKCHGTGSIDETIAIEAGTYCCPGVGGAQTCYEIAVNTSIPIIISNSGIDCRFCNTEQCATCTDENHPPIIPGCRAIGGPTCIPAGIFCIGESSGGLTTANELAMALATASLVCLYTNSTTIKVGTDTAPRDLPPGSLITGSCDQLENVSNGMNGADGAPGSDGTDGPQTGCTGNCLAVYS